MPAPIAIAYGDGVGTEIMESVLLILKEAEVPISIEVLDVGNNLYRKYYTFGIMEQSWDTFYRTSCLLIAPIEVPKDPNYQDFREVLRKKMNLHMHIYYINSFFTIKHNVDVIIIQNNSDESDIEYTMRFAFDFAHKNNKFSVSYFSQNTISENLKQSLIKTYPNISYTFSGTNPADILNSPKEFQVVVIQKGISLPNFSDEIINLSSFSNIGKDYAMFGPMHGTNQNIVCQNIVNPSGLISAAIAMLNYLELFSHSNLISKALKKTIAAGIRTVDIYSNQKLFHKISTKSFTHALLQHLES